MAVEFSNITGNFNIVDAVSTIPGVSTIVKLSQIAIVVIIVYLVFLIIRSVTQILYSLRFKKVAKNVEEINKKMDVLIGKRKK